MQLDRQAVYSRPFQRISWVQHYLKARFKAKERPRVQAMGRHVNSGDVILDVGAHFGYLTKEFARLHNGACRVIAFEPVAYTRSILERVVRRFPNVRTESFALSDQNGTVEITIPVKQSGVMGIGLSHFGAETQRDFIVEEIQTRRLDDYAMETGLERIGFIKADVEGAELLVLKGAITVLRQHRPIIYLEVGARLTQRLGYTPAELFSFLAGFGYAPHTLDERGALTRVPGHDAGNATDYVFCPQA